MGTLNQIKTREYKKDELEKLSETVARESGEEWVSSANIAAYNQSLGITVGKFKAFLWVLIHEHPNIGFFLSIFIPGALFAPCILLGWYGIIICVLAAFIGFFLGSFLFPSLLTNCTVCKSLRSCERVFAYVLESKEHTEIRRQNENTKICVLVKNEKVFAVMECKKCHGRQIEIITRTREEIL